MKTLRESGYEHVFYTTHSHREPDSCSLRIAVRLSRPVKTKEFRPTWRAMIAHLGIPSGIKTDNIARFWYFPSHKPGADYIANHVRGTPLDVDAFAAEESRFVLTGEDQEEALSSAREVLDAIRKIGQKGLDIQRYKGLGEMNPDQLWETTMDPERRILKRIGIEDTVKADHMFTVLMGSKVEPRREFIETHALEVRNLDV